MLAMLHISQSGTVYVYQGEEIAMANVPKSWGIEEYKDVATQQYWDRSVFYSELRLKIWLAEVGF